MAFDLTTIPAGLFSEEVMNALVNPLNIEPVSMPEAAADNERPFEGDPPEPRTGLVKGFLTRCISIAQWWSHAVKPDVAEWKKKTRFQTWRFAFYMMVKGMVDASGGLHLRKTHMYCVMRALATVWHPEHSWLHGIRAFDQVQPILKYYGITSLAGRMEVPERQSLDWLLSWYTGLLKDITIEPEFRTRMDFRTVFGVQIAHHRGTSVIQDRWQHCATCTCQLHVAPRRTQAQKRIRKEVDGDEDYSDS